jgi:hypothetical protein
MGHVRSLPPHILATRPQPSPCPPLCAVPYPGVAALFWVQPFDTHAELEFVPFFRTMRHLAEAVYRLELCS